MTTGEVNKSDLKAVHDSVKELTGEITTMGNTLAVVLNTLENMPKLDKAIHAHLETKQEHTATRVSNLEANQKWVIITILGSFILQIWEKIVK